MVKNTGFPLWRGFWSGKYGLSNSRSHVLCFSEISLVICGFLLISGPRIVKNASNEDNMTFNCLDYKDYKVKADQSDVMKEVKYLSDVMSQYSTTISPFVSPRMSTATS